MIVVTMGMKFTAVNGKFVEGAHSEKRVELEKMSLPALLYMALMDGSNKLRPAA